MNPKVNNNAFMPQRWWVMGKGKRLAIWKLKEKVFSCMPDSKQAVNKTGGSGIICGKRKSLSRVSLWPHGLYSPWNSSGQNAGVGSHFLLQGIFPTQELNPGFLHCRQILYQLNHKGSPSRGIEGKYRSQNIL